MKRIVLMAVTVLAASSGVLHADPWKKSVDANLTIRPIGGAFREYLDRDILDSARGARWTETTTDGGILFVSDFVSPLADCTMMVTSRFSLYEAFFYSESKKLEGRYDMDYWKSPDINGEIIFAANVNKYLMVNLYAQFLYDKEVDPAGRFKESLALGITYKLM